MSANRIRMGHPYGQTPANVYSDFDWIRRHEADLLAQYGECSIIVYNQQVIGTGPNYAAALDDAEIKLPPDVTLVTPVHERLRYRHPFLKVRPTNWERSNKVESK